MSERSSGSAFSIGSQQAGAIYQAAGDQIIHRGGGELSANLLAATSQVRTTIADASGAMADDDQREATLLLDGVELELRQPEPDKPRIATALERVARILDNAGKLAVSADALRQLASWLGAAGAGLIQLL